MLIYRLLQYVAIVADLAIVVFLYYIFKAIKSFIKKEKLTFSEWIDNIGWDLDKLAGNFTKGILIVAAVAMLLTNTAVHQFVGVKNLKIKPEGTYCFYVEATRWGGKTYTLPAQVRVEKEIDEVAEGKSKTYTYYFIEKVFFSNGGYLDVDDSEPDEINEASTTWDKNDDEWQLVLLNEPAYSPDVEETNNATVLDMVYLLLESVSVFVFLYALFKRK